MRKQLASIRSRNDSDEIPLERYLVEIFFDGRDHFAWIDGDRESPETRTAALGIVRSLIYEHGLDFSEIVDLEEILSGVTSPKMESRPGFIYLIEGIGTSTFKIGRTAKLSERLNAFGVLLPFETALIHSFPARDMFRSESRLHRRFSSQRVRSEWFSLNPQDVQYIKSIKSE